MITGAGSGVGKAMACALAGEETTLCLVGRTLGRLEAVAALIRPAGGRVNCYPVDLSRDQEIRAFGERLRHEHRSIDTLVHSAGMISLGSTEDAPVEDLDRQYHVNLRAPYLLTQRLLPMLKACQGQIVFINSTAGMCARAGVGQYAATKHALRAVADSLRDEINIHGVRVLSVFLGRTATPMQAAVHHIEGRIYEPEHLIQPQDVASVILSAMRLPRTAEVTEISVRPLRKPVQTGRG